MYSEFSQQSATLHHFFTIPDKRSHSMSNLFMQYFSDRVNIAVCIFQGVMSSLFCFLLRHFVVDQKKYWGFYFCFPFSLPQLCPPSQSFCTAFYMYIYVCVFFNFLSLPSMVYIALNTLTNDHLTNDCKFGT